MPRSIINSTPITWEEGKENLVIPFRAESMIHVQVPLTVSEPLGGEGPTAPRFIALFDVRAGGEGRVLFRVEVNVRKHSLRLATGNGPGVGAPQRALDGKGPRTVDVIYEDFAGPGTVQLWLDGKPVAETATDWVPDDGQALSLMLGKKGGEAAAPIGFTFHGLGLGIGQQVGAAPEEPEQQRAEEPPAPAPAEPQPLVQGLVHLYGIALPAVVGYYGDMGASLVENEHDIAEQAAKLAEAAYAVLLERQKSGAWSPEKWRGL